MSDLIERRGEIHHPLRDVREEFVDEAFARIRELEADVERYRDLAGATQTKWALKWQEEKQRAETAEAERDTWKDVAAEAGKAEIFARERAETAEAERDAAKEALTRSWTDRTIKIANGIAKERAAIEAATIERCARWLEDIPEHWRTLARDMRRALAKPPADDELESGVELTKAIDAVLAEDD
jgi:hypothetical protein